MARGRYRTRKGCGGLWHIFLSTVYFIGWWGEIRPASVRRTYCNTGKSCSWTYSSHNQPGHWAEIILGVVSSPISGWLLSHLLQPWSAPVLSITVKSLFTLKGKIGIWAKGAEHSPFLGIASFFKPDCSIGNETSWKGVLKETVSQEKSRGHGEHSDPPTLVYISGSQP